MRANDFAFIAEEGEGYDFPLQNFLPPLPKKVLTAWAAQNQLEGHFLIDPISANPILPIELATFGYKVLASRSNPINWLITEVACRENNRKHIASAVNQLLTSRKNDESLEDILRPIYLTPCSGCGKLIQADGFVWEKEGTIPISRVYSCPHCGDAGEKEITDVDVETIRQLGNVDIYRARAIQRVRPEKAYEKESLAAALDCYLPRALFVCMLLVNRMEIIDAGKEVKKFMRAALLTVFNDAHALQHWPPRHYRFLQFSIPQRFFENNLYKALIHAQEKWPEPKDSVPITYWPKLPTETGGICFFQSRLTENQQLFEGIDKLAAVTIFPRPGQAYWTFSALWAGWLWGKNAVKPLRSALARRRYDWFWYSKAINQSIRRIPINAQNPIRIFGLFPHFTPNLAYGLFAGMQSAGLRLRGAAFRNNEDLLQAEWDNAKQNPDGSPDHVDINAAIHSNLINLNEPVAFQDILMLVIIQAALNGQAARTTGEVEENAFSRLNNQVKQFAMKPGFLISDEAEPKYLLFQRDHRVRPYSEEVELFIFKVLQQINTITFRSIDRLTCARFKEHLAPQKELIKLVMGAYAELADEKTLAYRLAAKESAWMRNSDVEEITMLLTKIGSGLGFSVSPDNPLEWAHPVTKEIAFDFFIKINALLADPILMPASRPNAQHFLVYPGSRAALIHYRLQEDQRLREARENGWHFVKFRHIRLLSEREKLSPAIWNDLVDRDPPMKEAPAQVQII